MMLLSKIKNYFLGLQKQEFYTVLKSFFLTFFCIIFGILYYQYSATQDLLSKINSINKTRKEAQLVLGKLKKVNQQSQEVNELLNKEPNFKIKNYFETILAQHKLKLKLKKPVDVASEVLYKKYTERQLTAHFAQISTQQLCEFLKTIEEKTRIYTKDLIITKTKGAALDVMLTIATLTPQGEGKSKTR